MASKDKEQAKKDTVHHEPDEIDELNELIEKARLQKKVLKKMIDQISKTKTKK